MIALQKFSDSLQCLERAHSLNPTDENIFILIGQVKIILGEYKGAITTLHDALKYSDNKDEVNYQIGLAYQAQKDFSNASSFFKNAIEININHENALYDLAYCLEQTGELKIVSITIKNLLMKILIQSMHGLI